MYSCTLLQPHTHQSLPAPPPQAKINDLIADGYPANQIVLQLHDWVMSKENQAMSAKSKAIICRQLAATDKCLVDGADETLQLLHLSSVALTALQT